MILGIAEETIGIDEVIEVGHEMTKEGHPATMTAGKHQKKMIGQSLWPRMSGLRLSCLAQETQASTLISMKIYQWMRRERMCHLILTL